MKSGTFLRDYVYTFVELLAPNLTRDVVQDALKPAAS